VKIGAISPFTALISAVLLHRWITASVFKFSSHNGKSSWGWVLCWWLVPTGEGLVGPGPHTNEQLHRLITRETEVSMLRCKHIVKRGKQIRGLLTFIKIDIPEPAQKASLLINKRRRSRYRWYRHMKRARTTGRDLAAMRVRADLRMADVALAMAISKSRVNAIEHLARVTIPTAQRYKLAVRSGSRKENERAATAINSDGPKERTGERSRTPTRSKG
jgi:hypothetical protein